MTNTARSGQPSAAEPAGAVAVLGTGIMGSGMARNLAAAGLPTTVWDRSPEVAAPLAGAGARVAGSAQDAVRDSPISPSLSGLPARCGSAARDPYRNSTTVVATFSGSQT
jgi:glycine/D-amino acid oxidase-like deaminating enzyme